MRPAAVDKHDLTLAIVSEGSGSPFDGMTLGQARCLNDAIGGLRVLVAGGIHRPEARLYEFGHMVLAPYGLRGAGDLTLYHIEPDGGVSSSSRVLSAALVRVFIVRQMLPDRVCWQCNRRLPRDEKVYDRGGLGRQPNGVALMFRNDGEWIYDFEQAFECERCWFEEG